MIEYEFDLETVANYTPSLEAQSQATIICETLTEYTFDLEVQA
jgi:hypothetical protein